MFLIKLKTVGNCIIPDLDNFIIYDGNNRIMDLDEYFDDVIVKRSMRAPRGDLYQLLSSNVIERVNSNDLAWKKQLRDDSRQRSKEKLQQEMKQNNKFDGTNKLQIEDILNALKNLNLNECIDCLDQEYFDNLSILDRILNDNSFAVAIRKKAKELLDQNLNQKIDQKFIVI